VLDDDRDADPFISNNTPSLSHVFDGDGANTRASELEFLSGNSGQYNRMRISWQGLTVAPGESISLLHFVVEQTGRVAAINAAQRFEQLQP
jgi:hypothetical protein